MKGFLFFIAKKEARMKKFTGSNQPILHGASCLLADLLLASQPDLDARYARAERVNDKR